MFAQDEIVDLEKEVLKRRIEDDHPEWREPRAMPKPIRDVLKDMVHGAAPREDHAHDPWWIMRVRPNCYRMAEAALIREGFESYSPTYKIIEPLPLRFVPPKKRHQAILYKREKRRRRFEGYVFVRRMFGSFDLNRLFELNGCGSIIKVAERLGEGNETRFKPVLIPDHEIELLRLVEADGTMDEVVLELYKGYRISKAATATQWEGRTRIVGRLDDARKTVLFVEVEGRITRIIAEADPNK